MEGIKIVFHYLCQLLKCEIITAMLVSTSVSILYENLPFWYVHNDIKKMPKSARKGPVRIIDFAEVLVHNVCYTRSRRQ